ncbi:MAG: putative NAD-dependent oxidoreductase [Candidatus Moanabacter tarae]|uniref:Putative NAD-dependent oxidoreductase n=1 Tax=Candidatus Moanibacter tarae TaxID=2200854 RepID=A0A2Z4AGJ4_9BACT|nr:MAG: putative NAD-dependent oxidoreductase [Candidatus Moanabacter tarae]|tara:strand:+ start:3933 stop:5906 length:1974 start_codon:yes stop_codon:yes gene_type:complete
MKNRWVEKEAAFCEGDLLKLRVYTSRLLGGESELVLHGGGNTSVKILKKDFFGDPINLLYVKGSGWDLETIETEGFAPVRMDVLVRMVKLQKLSDADMVLQQRAAMLDPKAPNPSVEAILHAIIPQKFVDHTHADAVIALTNNDDGEKRVEELYGDRVLIIPYVMPGFDLARKVYEMTRGVDFSKLDGLVLMKHGIFTFHDDVKTSYDMMIDLVSMAENFLRDKTGSKFIHLVEEMEEDLLGLSQMRKAVSRVRGEPVLAVLGHSPEAVGYSCLDNIESVATRGPLTPDHVIRTKSIPVIIEDEIDSAIEAFANGYKEYFHRNSNGRLKRLDPAPRYAIWKRRGTVVFGNDIKECRVIGDIVAHTVPTIQLAEAVGGWRALPEKELFEMEYWELEQAKLKERSGAFPLQGKIALITGAASGIGLACSRELKAQGAVVVGLDINPVIESLFSEPGILGLRCDVTKREDLQFAVDTAIRVFGGLDILVSNAGAFPLGSEIEDLTQESWEQSLEVNLSSHQRLLQLAVPFLKNGIESAVVIIGSRNVHAPGPGASSYSVAKAGLTQLARVAALELAPSGIRVNVLHPDAVFDTDLWTPEVLQRSADRYGITIEEYKKRNLLKTEILAEDVARMVCAVAGPVFSKTTGAQIPLDGGNERVI